MKWPRSTVTPERWEETRIVWNDSVLAEFAKDHLEPIEPAVLTTLGAIDRLAQVLIRLRQECND